MMLSQSANMPPGCSEFMFTGQEVLQQVFKFTALACIPVMLLGKPLYILFTRRKPRNNQQVRIENLDILYCKLMIFYKYWIGEKVISVFRFEKHEKKPKLLFPNPICHTKHVPENTYQRTSLSLSQNMHLNKVRNVFKLVRGIKFTEKKSPQKKSPEKGPPFAKIFL